ncbi:MAG: EutN/CcmL family microcompartment protein [Candidatus Eremiobacteraeota bacterium]|nr:EutN/CcmL family microcompartment protein [Candidatus Eremiobacteraeota bacterium]
MQPGRVIGRVVATKKTSTLEGVRLLLVQPTDWEGKPQGDPFVAIDAVGSGSEEFIFYVSAREAAVAVDAVPPVDAAIVGIIDGVELEKEG